MNGPSPFGTATDADRVERAEGLDRVVEYVARARYEGRMAEYLNGPRLWSEAKNSTRAAWRQATRCELALMAEAEEVLCLSPWRIVGWRRRALAAENRRLREGHCQFARHLTDRVLSMGREINRLCRRLGSRRRRYAVMHRALKPAAAPTREASLPSSVAGAASLPSPETEEAR